VSRDNTLLIDGPATVTLQEGEATILAAPIKMDSPLEISKSRRVPIETSSKAILQIRLGRGGGYRQTSGSTVPPSWQQAARTLAISKGLAIILGDVDSGKSTLCTYLANTCLEHGIRTSVIDGDIGQADIGPPTTASSSTVSKNILNLQELRPEKSYFVGHTSPTFVSDKLVRSMINLKENLPEKNELTIVNTDGWIREEAAIQHKIELLANMQPDIVLGLSLDHELDPILDRTEAQWLPMKASKHALTRTRDQRRRAREEGYRRFFQNAQQLDLRLSKIKLRTFGGPRQERFDRSSEHKGAIAGLLVVDGSMHAIGRVVRIDNGILRVTTNATQVPKIVELGAVVLSSRFEEMGFEA